MKYAIVTDEGLKKPLPTVMDLFYEIEQGEDGWHKGSDFTVEQHGVTIFNKEDYRLCAESIYKQHKADKVAGIGRAKIKPMSIKRILQHKEALQSEGC